jgi:hypothetical protein
MKMRLFIFSLFFIGVFLQTNAGVTNNFDRKDFYRILKSGTLDDINNEISLVQSSGMLNKDAFEGTLLMKKAGLVTVAKQKLQFFKSGRIKLETVISTDSANVEYRFMRLIIQEHAPKVVKYQDQIETDAAFITKHFKNVSPELQQIIIDYSKNSKTLNIKDIQL